MPNKTFLEWLHASDFWCSLWGSREQAPHKHTFDSANGVEHYGHYLVLSCSCGAGRVLEGHHA